MCHLKQVKKKGLRVLVTNIKSTSSSWINQQWAKFLRRFGFVWQRGTPELVHHTRSIIFPLKLPYRDNLFSDPHISLFPRHPAPRRPKKGAPQFISSAGGQEQLPPPGRADDPPPNPKSFRTEKTMEGLSSKPCLITGTHGSKGVSENWSVHQPWEKGTASWKSIKIEGIGKLLHGLHTWPCLWYALW